MISIKASVSNAFDTDDIIETKGCYMKEHFPNAMKKSQLEMWYMYYIHICVGVQGQKSKNKMRALKGQRRLEYSQALNTTVFIRL